MIYSYKKKQNKENIIQVAPNLSPAFQPLVYYQAVLSMLFDQRVLLDVQLFRSRCCFQALSVGEMIQALDVLYGFFQLPASSWWSELKMENILVQMNNNIAICQFQLNLTVNFLVQIKISST